MIFGKAFAFCIFFLLVFSVQNVLALEDDDDDEKPYFDFSVFQDKDKYEQWKNDKIKVLEREIEKIKQVNTEDKYLSLFNGYFPPCEMDVWKEYELYYLNLKIKEAKSLKFHPIRSNKNTAKDRTSEDFVEAYKNGKLVDGKFPEDEITQYDLTKSDDYNEEGFERDSRGKLKLNLPECLQGEYSYEKFNTLYDSRIHNVTNHSYRNSDYNANITAIVAPVTPVVEDKTLEVDVSEEQNEPILLNGESTREAKQEKSFLKRLIDKIRNYIWVKS